MSGRFSRVALVVSVDDPPEIQDLWRVNRTDSVLRSRLVFHETVHFWQQISQASLLFLAAEDWQRLETFERTGEASGPGPLAFAFTAPDEHSGISAKDLHEMLARFWEVVAIGPPRVLQHDWHTRRRHVHRDYADLYSRLRQESGVPADPGAWGPYDLFEVLVNSGDAYAAPLLPTITALGQHWPYLLPCLGHAAMMTGDPARMFRVFVDRLGEDFSKRVTNLLTQSDASFDSTMNAVVAEATDRCFEIAAAHGVSMLSGIDAYPRTGLATNDAYCALFDLRVAPAGRTLANTGTVRRWTEALLLESNTPEDRFIVGTDLLMDSMATPGLDDSRALLLLAGLAPPCIQGPPDRFISFTDDTRQAVHKELSVSNADEVFRAMGTFAERPETREVDQILLAACVDVHRRWLRFLAHAYTPEP